MDKYPVSAVRRKRYEAVIRACDMVIYGAVFTGAFYALFATPGSVRTELQGWEWVIYMWVTLLFLGGGLGLAGRIFRIWMLELPATVAGFTGTLIYLVLIGKLAFVSVEATVAASLVLVAMIEMARRYCELQIYGEEPGLDDFRHRLVAMLQRRTANAVEHS